MFIITLLGCSSLRGSSGIYRHWTPFYDISAAPHSKRCVMERFKKISFSLVYTSLLDVFHYSLLKVVEIRSQNG